jgi:hypothetical protein
MAYTCNLLLRTLPAIARDNGLQPQQQHMVLDFSDWPDREHGSVPGQNLQPHPSYPGWEKGPAVMRRALAAIHDSEKTRS